MLAAARRQQPGRQGKRSKKEILDVEFERVADKKSEKNTPDSSSSSSSSSNTIDASHVSFSKSWLEWSLEADPTFNSTRIPFFYSNGHEEGDSSSTPPFIDARLAFLVDLDGATYGIGVPFDHAVALTLERDEKAQKKNVVSTSTGAAVEYLPPTSENEELMEIMAAQLHQHVGHNDLYLQRTPRILTVRGPLENYTQNWKEDLFPQPLTIDQLMDETDEDLDEFHRFMKAELGEEEYLKTMNEDSSNIPTELLEFFSIPGLGDQKDDIQGMTEFIQSMFQDPPEVQEENLLRDFQPRLDHDGAALKLVSYIFPANGKTYSLVSLLKPYVLVAKCCNVVSPGDNDDDKETSIRFELLSPKEEQLLIPRLEKVCKADLDKAGLQLLNP